MTKKIESAPREHFALDAFGESKNDTLKSELKRILDDAQIADEATVLKLIVEAITSKYVEPDAIEQAVYQTINQYENKLRVFSIAAANRQLKRITNLIGMVEDIEGTLGQPEFYKYMEPKDLIRLYAVAQGNLSASMDYVKNVINYRVELVNAQKSMNPVEKEELQALSQLPKLEPQQRDRIRRLIQGIRTEIIDEGPGISGDEEYVLNTTENSVSKDDEMAELERDLFAAEHAET